jgi:hypothetical protein
MRFLQGKDQMLNFNKELFMRQSIISLVIVFLFFFNAHGARAKFLNYFPSALYGTDGNFLYIIDKVTGRSTRIGHHGDLRGSVLGALAFDSKGKLYGISLTITNWQEEDMEVEARLYSISPRTGLASSVGPLDIEVVFEGGLCFDGDDNLFGVNQGDASDAKLFRINTLTGAATIVGLNSARGRDINGLAFDGDTLYATERKTNTVGTLDTATGMYKPIGGPGPFLAVGNQGGLAFDPDNGTLYATLGGVKFCSIDTGTGAATFIGFTLAQRGLTFAPPSSLSITFDAAAGNGSVTLSWATESEADIAGFNIYRSRFVSGEYLPVNDEMIAAEGSSTEGAVYEFIDDSVQNRRKYYYTLEVIGLDDSATMHGLVAVKPRQIYGK